MSPEALGRRRCVLLRLRDWDRLAAEPDQNGAETAGRRSRNDPITAVGMRPGGVGIAPGVASWADHLYCHVRRVDRTSGSVAEDEGHDEVRPVRSEDRKRTR